MTQAKSILRRLKEKEGQWVSMVELSLAPTDYGLPQAFATHSRIADLRKEGYRIENKVEHEDGRRKSYYRLSYYRKRELKSIEEIKMETG